LWYFESMTALEKIKAEASKLNPDQQYDLFRWWIESDGFKQKQLTALKRDIAAGIEDLENGRYKEINSESDAMRLAEDIGKRGRERLAEIRKNKVE
jgi:hypothetical protein